MPLVPGTVY